VSTRDDREAGIERQLGTVLRRRVEPPPLACPDAELIAGYVEQSLSAEERALIEGHLVRCARCQEVLTLVLRSELADEGERRDVASRWWTLDALRARWLVPAAAAVIVLAVALAGMWPRETARDPAVVTTDRTLGDQDAGERAAAPEPAAAKPTAPAETPAAAPPPAAPANARARSGAPGAAEPGAAAIAEQALTPKAFQAEAPAPLAAMPPAADAERAAAREIPSDRAAEAGSASPGQATAAAPPDFRVLVRVGPGGAISRSTDTGRTWVAQASGVEADLLGAGCVSAEVCWVVGRGGTVLRTTDGATWQRVTSPSGNDLLQVAPVDALRAEVRDAERGYVTRDGGRSWHRAP
jgi:hypothetical protein